MSARSTKYFVKLKSTSEPEVYKALLEIRKNVSSIKEGAELLSDHNIIPILVNHLRKGNKNIVDVCLSILGNACLQKAARKQAFDAGVSEVLVNVLNCDVIHRDSIRGRACRLVGNLAQDTIHVGQLHLAGISPALTKLNDATNSFATIQMLVRAVRILWSTADSQFRTEMLERNLVQNVAIHLKTPQTTDPGREVVKAVLKALAVITKSCSDACAEQVKEGSSKFTHLVSLGDTLDLREVVITTISNLCRIESCRPTLGNAGVVDLLLSTLMDVNNSYIDVVYQNSFKALCLLARESVNRAKIRRAGGMSVFLSALQRVSEPTANEQRSQALVALVFFSYDELGMAELLHAGLFEALSIHLAASVEQHRSKALEKHREKSCSQVNNRKRMRESSPCHPAKKDLNRSVSSDCADSTEQHFQGDWSPTSSKSFCYSPGGISSPSPSSSCSSPPPTPAEYDWPDLYSPVTAEYNETDDDNGCEEEESGVQDSWKDMIQESEDSLDSDMELPKASTRFADQDSRNILLLMTRISFMEFCLEELELAPTLETLIDYTVQFESAQHYISTILGRFIRNKKCFLPLVQEGFVLSVHGRCMQPEHRDCEKCVRVEAFGMAILQQITVQAESSFGTGEMEHVLHRGESEIRTALALSIPHIIKNTTKLRKLLLGCNGLDTILSTLHGKDVEKCLKHAPYSLHSLCLSLSVSNPAEKKHFKETPTDPSRNVSEYMERPSSNSLTILLDCGTKVYADREILCRYSPFFSAMLSESGSWSEAGKTEVELHDVAAVPLRLMLSVAAGGHPTESLCKKAGLENIIHTIKLLDRFLFNGVDKLCALVLQCFLSPSSVATVFLEAAQCGQPELMTCIRLGAVRYLLVAKMLATERQQAFRLLLQSSKREIFLADLSRLLRSELTC